MFRAVFALGLAASVTALPARQEASHSADPATSAAVMRASKYFENYRKEFSAIVCEERQVQTLIKPDGRVRKRRVLVSDLMFVRVGTDAMPSGFRDVISVDGKPVRNREERLRKLFIDKPSAAAADQARAIAVESGRYDLGIPRIGESPLLPIGLLDSPFVSNFRFALSGRTLTFEEIKSPTYMRTMRRSGMQYLASRGSLVVDPQTGAISAVNLAAEAADDGSSRTFAVRYEEHPKLRLLVPVEMAESSRFPARPKDDRFEANYTYSGFRRFQVTTSEIIK